jgi:hypothetical protein
MDAVVQLDESVVLASDASSCRNLWAEVALLAWNDFVGNTVCDANDRAEAAAFCLRKSGKWQRARALVCALAGIDPEALREAAERV